MMMTSLLMLTCKGASTLTWLAILPGSEDCERSLFNTNDKYVGQTTTNTVRRTTQSTVAQIKQIILYRVLDHSAHLFFLFMNSVSN